MGAIDTFRAVHASGLLVPTQSAVTALSLLFEKVYLPLNIELIRAIAQANPFVGDHDFVLEMSSPGTVARFRIAEAPRFIDSAGNEADPLSSLNARQRLAAHSYLKLSSLFAYAYRELFGEVFETNAFKEGEALIELIRHND